MAWIIGVGSLGVSALLPAARGSDWPQFRGPDRNNISKETGLLRKWPAAGPKLLWSVPVAQGYAGAAIVGGRVYHHDYDEAKSEWCVNCRSLADGKLIWQFREAREIRPNHAITRTVPAVDGRFVFSLDPKAVLHCLDAKTGKQVWRKSLVTEYQGHHSLLVQRADTRCRKPTGSSSPPAAPPSWWRSTKPPARRSGARRIPGSS